MRKVPVLVASTLIACIVIACKKDDPPPATQANVGQPPNQPYNPNQPNQPNNPNQPNQPYPPQPNQPYPGQPMPAQPQLATPAAHATPCQNDTVCITHKCNVAAGKCAFPCATDFDCLPGSYCFMGLPPPAGPACVLKAPGQP